MAIAPTDERMTSDRTTVVAERVQAHPERWIVTGRHGLFDRNQAMTAMVIAELQARTPAPPNAEIRIASLEQELLVPPMPVDPWALLQTLRNAARAASSITSRPEFDAAPFLGDVAEIAVRTSETSQHLGELVDKVADIAGDMAEGADPDDETCSPELRHWAQATLVGVRAAALLAEVHKLLQEMHRETAAAQHLGRTTAAAS